ncbi:DEAD-like helicases superfamily protein [Pleurostoma richardsiae]|uniref:DEAD-like helicases superfamily protein n=1 Tax=Pleurostoma richardsiae TaxID=41990 RepID=A0AA38VAX8_9PEZI|nr:DEAD-like helicases superfamily protein [Pleurostoma richardsiae]
MVRVGAGQSFATNPQNKWLEPGPGKLWVLKLFREGSMPLVHVWGGQPGRGPEMATLRYCDTWQLMRNMLVIDGQVALVTDRDKMKGLRDNGRKVAQFLLDQIGRMMVAYVAWLLPAERMLRRGCKLAEPQGEQLAYMWRDGDAWVWDTARLSAVLARAMQAGTGVWIGVVRYRPIAIELGRRIRGLAMRQAEARMEDADEDDNVDVDPLTGEAVDVGGGWNIVWDL